MNNQNINWNQLNKKVPISFHNAITAELNRQLAGQTSEKNDDRKKTRTFSRRYILPAAIAAALAIGTTALAGPMVYSHLEEFFGWNRGEVAGLVQPAPEALVEDTTRLTGDLTPELVSSFPALPSEAPLLDVQETLVDGSFLYVYANITEEGLKYDLGSDRLFLNDKEIGPVEYWTDGSLAVLSVDVSKEDLSQDFTVSLPLSVYAKDDPSTRYQNQEYTFNLKAVDSQLAFTSGDQTYQLTEEISAQLENLSVSPTQVSFSIRYCLPENQQKYASSIQGIVVKTPDGDTLAMKSIFINDSRSGSQDGLLYQTLDYAGSQGVPAGTEYLIIYPELADTPDSWHIEESLAVKVTLN